MGPLGRINPCLPSKPQSAPVSYGRDLPCRLHPRGALAQLLGLVQTAAATVRKHTSQAYPALSNQMIEAMWDPIGCSHTISPETAADFPSLVDLVCSLPRLDWAVLIGEEGGLGGSTPFQLA